MECIDPRGKQTKNHLAALQTVTITVRKIRVLGGNIARGFVFWGTKRDLFE